MMSYPFGSNWVPSFPIHLDAYLLI